VLYSPPADPAAFDRYDDEVHTPLAQKIPGVQSITVLRPTAGPDGTPPQFHAVATLTFEDEVAMATALATPEGRAAVEDLGNFAQAGVVRLS
jgi:uncharacterized protein (TIGR02118 family)